LRTAALAVTLLVVSLAAPPALRAVPQPIEVRVVDEAARPLSGVLLEIAAVAGDDYAATQTSNELGLAAFELPTAKRAYRLRIDHPDFAGFEREFDLAAEKAPRGDVVRLEVTLTPPGAVDRFNRAVRAIEARDLAGAEAELRRAVELEPAFAKGWSVLAFTLLELERPEEALAAAERALATAAEDVEALRLRYDALAALGRHDDADAALDELAAHDDSAELARVLFNAGATAANSEQPERARRRLGEALARDPALWQVHSALAELEIREQRLERALDELDKALAVAPRQVRMWERKLEVLRALGRGDEAAAVESRLAELRADG
jgi:tetratricopeptide (TPR) repeat protein